jgi:hypothetical protein
MPCESIIPTTCYYLALLDYGQWESVTFPAWMKRRSFDEFLFILEANISGLYSW